MSMIFELRWWKVNSIERHCMHCNGSTSSYRDVTEVLNIADFIVLFTLTSPQEVPDKAERRAIEKFPLPFPLLDTRLPESVAVWESVNGA